jgi:hypothetical protein
LDELHKHLVLDLMKEFVELRGVEKSPQDRKCRCPRTCIFSASDIKVADVADSVLHVSQGKVAEVNVQELETLRVYARNLFEAMDVNSDNLVSRKEFVQAVRGAPWASELLGVTGTHMGDDEVSKIFDVLDNSGNGEVDFDELTDYLRLRFDAELPRILDNLHSMGEISPQHESPTRNAGGVSESLIVAPTAGVRNVLKRGASYHDMHLGMQGFGKMRSSNGDAWEIPDIAIELPMPLARQPTQGFNQN